MKARNTNVLVLLDHHITCLPLTFFILKNFVCNILNLPKRSFLFKFKILKIFFLCLTVFYLAMFDCCLLEACSFLMREKGSWSGGEEECGRSERSRGRGNNNKGILYEKNWSSINEKKLYFISDSSRPNQGSFSAERRFHGSLVPYVNVVKILEKVK